MKNIIVKYYQPVILFVLTLTIASFCSMIEVDPHHQGTMFKPALDVAHGQMLFRDTFTQYGALTTLLQAWALQIFGDYMMVIQIETAIFYGLISVCLYFLWLNILPRWLTTTSVVIWLFLAPYFTLAFHPWSSVYALFFQLLSLLLLLCALREHNRLIIILAGCVAVLAFWCRQPVGIFHCVFMVFFLATTPLITGQKWKDAMIDCTFFMAGIAAASMPFFIWLALNGAIYDMYLQSIKAAFLFGVEMNNLPQSHNLFMKILQALVVYDTKRIPVVLIWTLLPLVCLYLLLTLAEKGWRNRSSVKNQLPLYGTLLFSLASWLQYYPAPCLRHCYWAATPMIGLFSYAAWRLCSFKKNNIQILILFLILVSVFGFYIGNNVGNIFKRIAFYNTRIEEPKVLRGMKESPLNAATYQNIGTSLRNTIKINSFPYLVNLSSDALYLTFIGPQNNFHPIYIHLGYNNMIYPDFQNYRDEFINRKHPLVLARKSIPPPGWTCVDAFNVIDFSKQWSNERPYTLALYRFTGNN